MTVILAVSVLPVTASAADDGIVYHVRPVRDGQYVTSVDKYNSYESEHFCFLWGNTNSARITEKWLEGNAAILEACWDLYVEDLGMNPPSLCTKKGSDQNTHYKVNVILNDTGVAGYSGWAFAGIDSEGFAYLMCHPDSMVPNPQTWVTPHEFGHATQFAQGYNSWANATYLGPWYEAMANWYREQFLYSDYYTSNQYYRTDFSHLYLRSISLNATNGRAYYEAWPILQYLTENPDNLEGYGSTFVSTLLENGSSTGYIYEMIEDLAEAELDETLGYFAAHMATFDLSRQDSYKAKIQNLVNAGEFFWQQFYTVLEPTLGEENTYTVPSERAPQEASYVVTPLEVTGGEIKVTLKGFADIKGAAWKACIVTVSGDETNYSELFGDGETVSVSADGVDEAYLTVAATPALNTYVKYDLGNEAKLNFNKKNRYPYEVTLEGAAPKHRVIETTAKGEAHPNGGGFVAKTANVSDSVYVGPNACVLGTARISGDVRLEDYAVVMDSAFVKGNVIIDGYAVVAGSARVTDNAHVGGHAIVTGSATVSDNAQVIESAFVTNTYKVTENAIAKGLALCLAGGQLSGQAVADGDLFDDSGAKLKKGTVAGYLTMTDTAYTKKLKSSDGMYFAYPFADDDGRITSERYSSTYAVVKGAKWIEEDVKKTGVYEFDGESAYIILDENTVKARDLQILVNMKWDGGDAGQRVFSYSGEGGEMYFTPKNENGKSEFVIGETRLEGAPVPENDWIEVFVTFADGKVALTVDKQTTVTETKELPAYFTSGNGYLGRNSDGNYYDGKINEIEFYFENAEDIEMAAAEVPPETEIPETGDTAETEAPADTEAPVDTEAPGEGGCGSSMGMAALAVALVSALGCAVIKKHR